MHKLPLRKPDGRRLILYSRRPLDPRIEATAPRSGEGEPPNSHLRWHPLRGEWVAYAGHRQNRTFLPPPEYNPLAPARDPEHPTEVPAGDWDAAVFENRFPTLAPTSHDPPESIVETRPGRGACEVVVFTQDALSSLGALPLWHLELLIEVWADRQRELGAREDVKYVFPFENRGVEVGVTLHHPHGQIYAYPFIPPIAARELSQQSEHYRVHGRGLLEALLEDELRDGRRILYGGPDVLALMPACARYSYEVWIAPRRPAPTIADLTSAERVDLARALKTVLLKYDGLWGEPFPYIMVFHQAPTDGKAHPEAHFHIEFYPAYRMRGRLKYLAGSEIGAGVFTADTFPEDKAAELRAVEVDLIDPAQSDGALRRRFQETFGQAPEVVSSAPGRVNLIGEHTDYNGGFVLPMVIPQRTHVALARRPNGTARVQSRSFGGELVEYELGGETRGRGWIDYVQGTTAALRAAGHSLAGFDLQITSNVPVGSGLSSSAALLVSVLRALREAFQLTVGDVEIALLARRAETEFVGAPVGVMDQMACSLGDDTHALFLDTRSMQYERVPFLSEAAQLVVIDSGVSHQNVGGGYRARRAECEEAARRLGVPELRDVGIESLDAIMRLPPPLGARARHVVTENARVLEAVLALLRRSDVSRLAALFDASHASMRDDFEVSVPEIDRLVVAARDAGALGARLTGGGFGGSIVALAPPGQGALVAAKACAAVGEKARCLVPPMTGDDGGERA